LGTLVPPGIYAELSGLPTTDLPAGCERLRMTAHHPTPSSTIVVFQFVLDWDARDELGKEFEREEPSVPHDTFAFHRRAGPLLRKVEAWVQQVRRCRRDAYAEWVSTRLPGVFASEGGLPAAEFITLSKALPLDHSSSDQPYLRALGLNQTFYASELWGTQGLRLRWPFQLGSSGDLLFTGRGDELSILDQPDDPGKVFDRVSSAVMDPLVLWALYEAVRRYTIRMSDLRDTVGEIAGDSSAGATRRLGVVQKAYMQLVADTVPLLNDIKELCGCADRYHGDAGEFHLINQGFVPAHNKPHVFETVRQRTEEEAHRLTRISSDVRDLVATTSQILGAVEQARATEENLALQRRVSRMTLGFGVLAAILALLQIFG
jgi:hypothetical protein